ncbi:MAG: steroid Delta-isomerase [Acidimicrobiaceae bacterium]|jgi:steroid delta-isomerase
MPDERVIRGTIENYWKAFTIGDRDAWVALFTDDATVEDPIGTPVHHGKEAIGAFFESAHSLADSIELRSLDITAIVGNEAAFAMEIRPVIGGTTFVLVAIDVMTFADDGRITSQRAFWQQEKMRPAD